MRIEQGRCVADDRSLVLCSTPESIAAGKLSVLAVIEVILSVAAYWWIAIRYETHIHLWIGILAAPLVLLRSDASVEKAKTLWERFSSSADVSPNSVLANIFAIALLVLAMTAMHLYATKSLLIDLGGWPLFRRSVFYNLASWIIAFGVAGGTVGLGRGEVQGALEKSSIATIAVGLAAAIPIAVTGFVAGWIAFAGAIAALTLMVIIEMSRVLASLFQVVIVPGFATGFWIRTILIRIFSVASYPLLGMRNGALNWRRIMLNEDCAHAAELIPGLPQTSFRKILGETVDEDRFRIRGAAKIIFLFVWFLPTLLWRYSLKSTFWFYLPLILITRPGALKEDAARKIRVDGPSPLYDKLSALFSLSVLVFAVIALIDWGEAWKWFRSLQGDAPFGPIGWLFVTNWGRLINEPWKWFVLAAAIATLIQYVWIDWLRNQREGARKNGFDPDKCHSPGLGLFWTDRLRNVLVILSFLVGGWYFTKVSYREGLLEPLTPLLRTVFGI